MGSYRSVLFFLIFSLGFLTAEAEAGSRRARIFGRFDHLFQPRKVSVNSIGKSTTLLNEPIRITGYEPAIGRFRVELDREKTFVGIDSVTGSRFFQGEARSRKSDRVATNGIAVAVAEKRFGSQFLRVSVEPRFSRRKNSVRMVDVILDAASSSKTILQVRRISTRKAHPCATESIPSSRVNRDWRTDRASISSVREVELYLEGDTEFFSAIPGAATQMASMVTISDAFYRRDLGVGLIAVINPTAQAFASTINYDSQTFILDFFTEMRAKDPNFNGDVYFVFTGKTPPSESLKNLAGVAAGIGVVCSDKQSSLGIVLTRFDSGTLSSFTAATLAHELGHVMAGTHDDTFDPTIGYIMNSGTTSPARYVDEFSAKTKSEVGEHIAANGSCLATGPDIAPPPGSGDPNPADPTFPSDSATIAILKSKFKKRAILYATAFIGESPVSDVPVTIFLKGSKKTTAVASGFTNTDGFFAFYPKKLGKYFVRVAGRPDTRAVNVARLKF